MDHLERTNKQLEAASFPQSDFKSSLRCRILFMAAICTLGFFIYTTVISKHSQTNAKLLKEIEVQRYPVQAHLINTLHHTKLIQSNLQDAVITGDIDSIENSIALASDFRTELESASKINPEAARTYQTALTQFNDYYIFSRNLAEDILTSDLQLANLESRGVKNADNYSALILSLTSLRDSHKAELASSVHTATSAAQDLIILSASIGVLMVILVLILALNISHRINRRISDIVQKLKSIAIKDGDLGVRIKLTGNDEMTEMSYWFNSIIEKLEILTNNRTAEIEKIAYTDFLTDMPNRRFLMNTLDSETQQTTAPDESVAVMVMDLDNFKPINDEFGHDAGDTMIRDVASRLQSIFQAVQTDNSVAEAVVRTAVVGRLGGDEFMAIVAGRNLPQITAELSENICLSLTAPFEISNKSCNVGVSIGIAHFPTDAQDVDQLIGHADLAMYEAKIAGKNQFRQFDPALALRSHRTNRISSLLKEALSGSEFSLVYQPKYNLSDASYAGAEALLRWNNCDLGPISPFEFIPIAESSNLIIDIDDWVLHNACVQITNWKNSGISPNTVSINVSAQQMCKDNYASKIRKAVNEHGIENSDLQIEITETSALHSLELVTENINTVRDCGVTVAMDDFGAGHSSLQLLINCQLDILKIDKSLVDQLEHDNRSASIINSIVSLSKVLGISTVAEGIENAEQREMLTSLDCDFGQGYWYSQPLAVDEFVNLIDESTGPRLRLVH